MKWNWLRGWSLALGLCAATGAWAQEGSRWDPPAEVTERPVALGKPQPITHADWALLQDDAPLRTVSHETFASQSTGPTSGGPAMTAPVAFPAGQVDMLPPATSVPGPAATPKFMPDAIWPVPAPTLSDLCCDPLGFASYQAARARGRLYGGAEYLLWWVRDSHLPPLVTTTPADVSQTIQGALTAPGTQVLFGGDGHNNGTFSGARFTVGAWVDPCALCGVEGTFFFLGRQSRTFQANSDQFPVLGRPFFNINTNMEDRQLTTTPGTAPGDLVAAQGRIRIDTPVQLWGAEANLRHRLLDSCDFRLDLLVGFRYLELKEGLHIQEDVLFTRNDTTFTLFNVGNHFLVNDRFDTRNQFYGGQIGAEAVYLAGRWSVDVTGKLALGANHQTIDINGNQVLTTTQGAMTTFPGGLLALPSNIGHHTRDRFAVVPEIGIKLGYQLTEWCRATVGYNFLFMNNVVRPGDQVDRVIDVTQVPNFVPPGVTVPPNPTGVPRPLVPFRETNFWAQGVTFGLEFRY
jgi:hypothetical protein